MTSIRRALFFVWLTAVLAGCSSSVPFDIVPVRGTITYDDGSRIPAGDFRLKFQPHAASPNGKDFPRVATALVNADGKFSEATTVKFGDGLTTGELSVYLLIGNGPDGKPLVPKEYTDPKATPLRVTVAGGQTLQLTVPRP